MTTKEVYIARQLRKLRDELIWSQFEKEEIVPAVMAELQDRSAGQKEAMDEDEFYEELQERVLDRRDAEIDRRLAVAEEQLRASADQNADLDRKTLERIKHYAETEIGKRITAKREELEAMTDDQLEAMLAEIDRRKQGKG